MGLKILHSADWHLDSPFGSLPAEVREALRAHQRRLPGLFADLCQQEQCDLVLLAGDLFDGKPTRESVNALKRGLARCEVPVFISPGNHDFCAPDSPWLTEFWPENVYLFTDGLSYYDVEELDCRVYGAGYRSMDCPSLLDGFQAEGDTRYCIGILHGDPLQKNSPCCPVTAPQVRESGLDYLALGHIHRAGSFQAGNTLCAWPGCPMGRGWDETGEKGVYLVDLEDTAQVRTVSLGLPVFHDLTIPLCLLEETLPPTDSEDFYRITLTGEEAPDIPALLEQYRYLAHLELRDETEEVCDPFAYIEEDSLRGTYFRLLQEKIDAGEDEAIVRLAAQISQRLLDGKEVALP